MVCVANRHKHVIIGVTFECAGISIGELSIEFGFCDDLQETKKNVFFLKKNITHQVVTTDALYHHQHLYHQPIHDLSYKLYNNKH